MAYRQEALEKYTRMLCLPYRKLFLNDPLIQLYVSMKKKHIVIDARIRPSSTGRYVDRLLEHLQEIDSANKYTVLIGPDDNWKPTANNFKSLVCPYKRFSFNPLDQITYAMFLRKLKPDLVHFAMTPQEPVFYFGKRVTTTHDLTMLRFTRSGRLPEIVHWVRMAGYHMLFWHSHKVSKKIIVPTEYVREDLIDLHSFTKDKIEVTYESTEPPLKIKSTPLKGVDKPFIMHVGSPFPHKNIEKLVEAFELIKIEQPDLKLVLAGKKEYYFDLLMNKISASKYKDDIVVPGFIEDSELKWLYENTACYVLPSLSEGFGLPGLEAMTHGAPLASSDATCLPEVYGDAAIYFDPLDIKSIAVVVNELLTDSKLANKLRTLGYKRVVDFSWKKMSKQTLDIYQSLLK